MIEDAAGAQAPIVVAGEALYDLVADDGRRLDGHPGGGPFNTARTIARLGQPVAFLGRLSTDARGATQARLLEQDGVWLRSVVRSDAPTMLALADIDADGHASYRFDAVGSAAAGLTPQAALAALPDAVAALHVGSLGLVLEPLASALEAVVERLGGETLIALDPNVRPSAIDDAGAYRRRLAQFVARSDLVKASVDDLAWLEPGRPPIEAARALLALGPVAVLLTRGEHGSVVVTASDESSVAVVPAEVVDTIGAGDAYNGGFLAWWRSRRLGRDDLRRHELVVEAARFAALVAARTVERAGASPPRLSI